MKTKHFLSAAALAVLSLSAQAGVLLSEGFNNVAGLSSSGWQQVSTSTGAGSGWFQGNAGVFTAPSGDANASGYAGANFVDTATTISDWLLTPVLALASNVTLNFDLRLLGGGVLDTVEVYASTAGSSSTVSDFVKIATYASSTDTDWASTSLSRAGFDGSGRLAFRYFVADTSVDGNYVGLDNVAVIPEPASLALVGAALAGLAVTRRRGA